MRKGIVIVLAMLAVAGCGQGEDTADQTSSSKPEFQPKGDDFSPVIARVGDIEITQAYFQYRYAQLEGADRQRYSGENWQQRFLDYLIDESLVYASAQDEKFDNLPEVKHRLDMARRSILVKAYYDKKFIEDLVPPEEEIEAYYAENQEEFQLMGRALGYHVQCSSKEKVDAAYAELKNGKLFSTVAAKYSEDENSRANEGMLGWFNPDGYVLGMGNVPEITERAFQMKPGTYSEPFKVGDDWHILKVGAIEPPEQEPLAKVRDRIIRKLRPVIAKQAYQQHLLDLQKEYGVEKFGSFQDESVKTAEQLYRLATETGNNHAKIDYYETLVEAYPQDERTDDALFMLGFIYSEEFGDRPMAGMYFRRLLHEWPQSDLADDAEFMLKNLGRKRPEVRGDELPTSAEEASERIESLGN
jgi:hypothetical protein